MKRERVIYTCWLVLFAVLIIAYSLWHGRLPMWGTARTIGILVFVMVDLLGIAMLLFGPRERRTRQAALQLLGFIVATGLYIYYCFVLRDILKGNSYWDAIVAGALLCAAMLLGAGNREKKND